jgi:hypothetical protein
MKRDPEPKDKFSKEWYEWEERKEKSDYPRLVLKRKQEGLSCANRPKDLDLLIGGKVTNVGFHPSVKEGGLTIDFEKDGRPMRMALGYTELGMWVEWAGERKK